MTRKSRPIMTSVEGMERDELEDRRIEQLKKRTLEDIAFVLKNPQGRRFMLWLLEQTGVEDQSYCGPGKIDDMTFNEGRRSLGIYLKQAIEIADDSAYIKMLGEYKRDALRHPIPNFE